jgi:hypothetical protein
VIDALHCFDEGPAAAPRAGGSPRSRLPAGRRPAEPRRRARQFNDVGPMAAALSYEEGIEAAALRRRGPATPPVGGRIRITAWRCKPAIGRRHRPRGGAFREGLAVLDDGWRASDRPLPARRDLAELATSADSRRTHHAAGPGTPRARSPRMSRNGSHRPGRRGGASATRAAPAARARLSRRPRRDPPGRTKAPRRGDGWRRPQPGTAWPWFRGLASTRPLRRARPCAH